MDIYDDPVRAIHAMADNPKGMSPYLKYHISNIQRARHYVADPNVQYSGIPYEILVPACAYINIATEGQLAITTEELGGIMALFPIEASRLHAGFNGDNTRGGEEDRRDLLNVIARFYLNAANWPFRFFQSTDLDFTYPKREDWMAALKTARQHFQSRKD